MQTTSSAGQFCTAVVCAYNEEKTIGGVLATLAGSPLVDQIIVVDDGSEDSTPSIIRHFTSYEKVNAIFLAQNRGKGYAMAEGILQAREETLFFVDADLLNLNEAHIAKILGEWHTGRAEMVIGYRNYQQRPAKSTSIFRVLSGERVVFRRDILPLVPVIRASRYGVETLINLHYHEQGKNVHYTSMDGLIHPIKTRKMGIRKAGSMYAEEIVQIMQAFLHHYRRKWKNASTVFARSLSGR